MTPDEIHDALFAAHATWPEDIKQKLSIHDLRRMAQSLSVAGLNIKPSADAVEKIDAASRSSINPRAGSWIVGK